MAESTATTAATPKTASIFQNLIARFALRFSSQTMRILLLTQFYPPEVGAAQNRLSDLTKRLIALGHQVEVLTAMPNYPHGKVFPDYRRRRVIEEVIDQARVIRTWIFVRGQRGFLLRLLSYFSFVLTSLFLGAPKTSKADVVILESPPLFLGISALILRFFKQTRLVVNVSDLWPESAVAMGMVKNKLAISLSQGFEEFLYRQADLVTGQTQGIVDSIRSRCPGKRVVLLTNGVDQELFSVAQDAVRFAHAKEKWGFKGCFVIGYTGLHGHAQDLEMVVEAASLLRDHRDFVFAFFGEGPEKENLQNLVRRLALTNVRFLPFQPRSEIVNVLSAIDVAVVSLKKLPLFLGALPSKMFEAMAAKVPLVLAVKGEAQTLMEAAGAGICVEPESASALADAILTIYRMPDRGAALGEAGQQYVFRHYNRSDIARRFAEELASLRTSDGNRLDPINANASHHP